MKRLIFPLAMALVMNTTIAALAAGGGGSAGGSGAQNAINSGRSMADGQPGPLGSPNNPRPRRGTAKDGTMDPGSGSTVKAR